jgi:hypothetical protein
MVINESPFATELKEFALGLTELGSLPLPARPELGHKRSHSGQREFLLRFEPGTFSTGTNSFTATLTGLVFVECYLAVLQSQ